MYADKSQQFGDWLRDARASRRINQAELARRCSLQASYLSAVERNRRPPPLARIVERIAAGIGLEPAEREATLEHAQHARRQWSSELNTRRTAEDRTCEGIRGIDPLVTFRCMLREAKRAAIETRATVEVASGHFRVVIRPERFQALEGAGAMSPTRT